MKLYALFIEVRNKYGQELKIHLVSFLNEQTGLIECNEFELSNKHEQIVFQHMCLKDVMSFVKEM